jgi:hypothetical protein
MLLWGYKNTKRTYKDLQCLDKTVLLLIVIELGIFTNTRGVISRSMTRLMHNRPNITLSRVCDMNDIARVHTRRRKQILGIRTTNVRHADNL